MNDALQKSKIEYLGIFSIPNIYLLRRRSKSRLFAFKHWIIPYSMEYVLVFYLLLYLPNAILNKKVRNTKTSNYNNKWSKSQSVIR